MKCIGFMFKVWVVIFVYDNELLVVEFDWSEYLVGLVVMYVLLLEI